MKSAYLKLTLKNNYQIPCEVDMYMVTPKHDTSSNPLADWQTGIDDNPNTTITAPTQIGQFPTDFDTFTKLWSIKKVFTKTLSPGQSCMVTNTVKDITIDPAYLDANAEAYQRSLKSYAYMYVVRGVLGHEQDAGTSNVGLTQAGVDWHIKSIYKVNYDAGIRLNDVRIDTQLDATIAPFVTSQKDTDNQIYSIV